MPDEPLSHEHSGIPRRTFLAMMGAVGGTLAGVTLAVKRAACETIAIGDVDKGEDVFSYVKRIKGDFDLTLYRQVIGAANEFKEGDQTIGVGAADEKSRRNARTLLANTTIKDLYEHPLLVDELQKLIWKTTDQARYEEVKDWTMGRLKAFLLQEPEAAIKAMMNGLTSDVIGCVPKLMTDEELIALGGKIFNPLPGTKMGAKGYMGARIQPNSPTDHPDRCHVAGFRCVFLCNGRHRDRDQPRGQPSQECRPG